MNPIGRLSHAQTQRMFERRCQALLGIDCDTLEDCMDSGELPSHPAVAHVLLMNSTLLGGETAQLREFASLDGAVAQFSELHRALGNGDVVTYEMDDTGSTVGIEATDGSVPVRAAGRTFHFSAREVVGPCSGGFGRVGYAYSVCEMEAFGREVVSWHLHRPTRSVPHLHIGRRHPELGNIDRMHLPSGRVSFVNIVGFMVSEMSARLDLSGLKGELQEEIAVACRR